MTQFIGHSFVKWVQNICTPTQNIYLNISYPKPIHNMKGFSYLGYKNGDFPVTEKLSKKIFSLPIYPSLSHEKQIKVCNEIKKIFEL
jgi:aminotransferase EvaB